MAISIEWWVVIATVGTAIGTILAVIVAIFGISLKKPKLEIEFQETAHGVYWNHFVEYIIETNIDTGEVIPGSFDYWELLVFVKNKGKKVAKNCQLKWVIKDTEKDAIDQFELPAPVSIIYDGVVMPKMKSRYFRPPRGNEILISVASGSREAFKLIYFLKQGSECCTYNDFDLDIQKDKKYEVKMTAYADDAIPFTKSYEFLWDGTVEGLSRAVKLR